MKELGPARLLCSSLLAPMECETANDLIMSAKGEGLSAS